MLFSCPAVRNDGWSEQFVVRFLGSVQVPVHMGNDVLCSAMQKVTMSWILLWEKVLNP